MSSECTASFDNTCFPFFLGRGCDRLDVGRESGEFEIGFLGVDESPPTTSAFDHI